MGPLARSKETRFRFIKKPNRTQSCFSMFFFFIRSAAQLHLQYFIFFAKPLTTIIITLHALLLHLTSHAQPSLPLRTSQNDADTTHCSATNNQIVLFHSPLTNLFHFQS
ncbi:unnamed protein product [Lathyrus sativus]|nr:unnamed protein product [Lathyrus sativus]